MPSSRCISHSSRGWWVRRRCSGGRRGCWVRPQRDMRRVRHQHSSRRRHHRRASQVNHPYRQINNNNNNNNNFHPPDTSTQPSPLTVLHRLPPRAPPHTTPNYPASQRTRCSSTNRLHPIRQEEEEEEAAPAAAAAAVRIRLTPPPPSTSTTGSPLPRTAATSRTRKPRPAEVSASPRPLIPPMFRQQMSIASPLASARQRVGMRGIHPRRLRSEGWEAAMGGRGVGPCRHRGRGVDRGVVDGRRSGSSSSSGRPQQLRPLRGDPCQGGARSRRRRRRKFGTRFLFHSRSTEDW